MSGWTGEFENALAWFKAAPEKLTMAVGDAIDAVGESIDSATQVVKENVQAAAEWVWVVIQGDFAADEQSGAQIVTGTIISMIPFVDQICDVRDIVANSVAIYNHDEEKDGSSSWKWLALALTLMGFIPCVGSFFKGIFKLLFLAVRKAFNKTVGKVSGKLLWEIAVPHFEKGIAGVNKFLQRPTAKKYIKLHKLDNIYKGIANKIREVSAKMSLNAIMAAFDDLISKLKGMLAFVKKWSPDAVVRQAENLEKIVNAVRMKADACLAPLFNPLTEFLEKAAQRLDREHEVAYRAFTNAHNPRAFKHISEPEEMAEYRKAKPDYVDDMPRKLPHKPVNDEEIYLKARKNAETAIKPAILSGRLKVPPAIANPPDLRAYPLEEVYKTFGDDLRVDVLPGGQKLYRVVDPGSADNSHCWMTEAEFKKLQSKSDWRRRFAVWVGWNKNGEYVTYTVPPEGMVVWRGTTATQTDASKSFMLEGGAEQIVVDPRRLNVEVSHLDGDGRKIHKYFSERQSTGWAEGYRDLGETQVDFEGLAMLLETNLRTY